MIKAYQIRIELVGSDPLIWRRVIIPADVTFRRLHDTIQEAMGWWDCHLHEFEFPQEKLRITNDEESYEEFKYYLAEYRGNLTPETDPHGIIGRILDTKVRKSHTSKIDALLQKHGILNYNYDFGDYWQHRIYLENIIDDYQSGHPILLEGEGACPPEDVGGIGGYESFREAWNDPNHPDHEFMRQWGGGQRYKDFNKDDINTVLWTLKLKKLKSD